MALFKCKMCGGDLVLTEGNPLVECEYCGSLQTVPSADNEKKLTLFARANRLRFGCEFDKAAGVYEALVADFPEEAEAYWGLILCKYGIEYVDDPATGKKIPTCHRSSFSSVMEDSDFEQTLENADAPARKVYREEAKQIEELRKGILEVSSKADPYDIFICYKETAENGQRTLDSVLAQDLYDALTEKGYRVFFSRITLEDKLGQEYEPYIFAALNSAKVMLAIGTDYEYYNAVWVRNEWSRYLKLMAEDHTRHLIPCYKGIDAYDMPKEFAKFQAQDLGKVGATQDLLRGIDKLIAPTAASNAATAGTDIAEMLANANEALENGDWGVASSRFDLALVADPKCPDAHLGKLLAECKCKKRENLAKSKKRLEKSPQYRELLEFADEGLKQELQGYSKKVKSRRTVRNLIKMVTAIAVVAGLLFGGYFVLEKHYEDSVIAFQEGTLSARDAYSVFNSLKWLKEDRELLFLSAAGMGDWNAASQYECEKLSLNTTTYEFLKDQTDKFNADRIKEIEIDLRDQELSPDMLAAFTNLERIAISGNGARIGAYAFRDNTVVKSITILVGVVDIGDCAFFGCTGLTSIAISDSVTSIGNSAFSDCSSLTSITIPDSVTSIGESAFSGCAGLTSITIPDSVTSIGASAFSGCAGLTSITIPDSVTSIGASAFSECTGLTSITIPDSVTSIGNSAFSDCSSLTSITIPDSVTSIGESAFSGCSGLTSYLDGKYDDAVALMNAGRLEEAHKIFQELGDYKDAADKADEIRFTIKKEEIRDAEVGQYITFGEYHQDNDNTNGKEEIEWLVLDEQDGKILVISKYILSYSKYNGTSGTSGHVSWSNCTLRSWLNSTFLSTAFTLRERTLIPSVNLLTEYSDYFSVFYEETRDCVFLLSYDEAMYYNPKSASPTMTAAAMKGDSGWWLRTSADGYYAYYAKGNGSFDNKEFVELARYGVRPAMWIDLSKI